MLRLQLLDGGGGQDQDGAGIETQRRGGIGGVVEVIGQSQYGAGALAYGFAIGALHLNGAVIEYEHSTLEGLTGTENGIARMQRTHFAVINNGAKGLRGDIGECLGLPQALGADNDFLVHTRVHCTLSGVVCRTAVFSKLFYTAGMSGRLH